MNSTFYNHEIITIEKESSKYPIKLLDIKDPPEKIFALRQFRTTK